MKFGLDVANISNGLIDPSSFIELAKEAEKSGWNGFFLWNGFLSDESYYITNPLVTMAGIATQTTKIKLGFLVVPLPLFKPWQIASEMVTLDHLSKGRMILGVGSGFNQKDFSSFNEESDLKERAEKLDESLDIIIGLWSGKLFSYSGKHYKIDKVQLLPTCYQTPRVPIWVAGFWPNKKPFNRAARYEGVYPGSDNKSLTPEEVSTISDYVKSIRNNEGPYDIIIWSKFLEDKDKNIEFVESYRKTGLTWMNTILNPINRTWDELIDIVKTGPQIR